MSAAIIVNDVADLFTVAAQILTSAERRPFGLVQPLPTPSQYPVASLNKREHFPSRAHHGTIPIQRANLEEKKASLDVGADISHGDDVHGLFMFIADKRQRSAR